MSNKRKESPNGIRSYRDNWAADPRNGLPFSGEAVQNFVRSQIFGDVYFDNTTSTWYCFHSTEDMQAWLADKSRMDLVFKSAPIDLTGNTYRIAVQNGLPSYNIQAATNMTELLLSLTFDVQTKQVTDTVWTSTGSGVTVKVYVDKGATGLYTEIPVGGPSVYVAGSTFSIDVREKIAIGANRVKVEFHCEDDATVTTSVVYNVTLAEMYIEEFNNGWQNALVEGVDTHYQLGGYRIIGALSKTLHVEIYQANNMVASFESLIGVSSYIDTPYYFTRSGGLNLSGLATGVYVCKAYLTAGELTSLPISYNFMYVAANDRFSAQLVVVNDIAEKAINYSTVALCDYAIYNGGQSTGTPHILVQLCNSTTPTTKINADYPDITTGEKHTLEYTIEWLIQETLNLSVYFDITIDGSSQMSFIPIDNTAVYPAEAGADFFMNASARTNNDTNRESVLNEAATPAAAINAAWLKMAWVEGIDGWTQDEDGRRALLIPAYSRCTIPYRVMQGMNMSFEICFKVKNVSDYSENIITAAENPTAAGFYGLRIRPNGITIHSSADTDASNDTLRSCSFGDEQTIHMIVSVQTGYDGNQGMNLVTCFLNGCQALSFSFESGTAWENNADFIIGSDTADVYVYYCRVYRKALGKKAAEQNFINSLRTLEDRQLTYAWFNSVLNESTHELILDKVMSAPEKYNFFIVEMKDGASVPSKANGWAKNSKGYSDFEMHFGEHPEWDFKLFGVETTGQGTTSMDYYRWNLRWRIDKSSGKAVPVAYYDTPTIGLDGSKHYNALDAVSSKTVWFDGVSNHPAVMRITAKINQASSMQSHKIGATRAFNDLQAQLELRNEAQQFAEANDLPMPVTAVYQYPAFGFSRTVTQQGIEVYQFIGLFTIGPDKGDKGTFGYNIDNSIKSELITMEGTDHSRRMAKFNTPWNEDVSYLASNECLNIIKGNNDYDNGWEIGNCEGLSTDDASDQGAINAVLERETKPAYDVAFNNSTLIFGIALGTYGDTAEATLAYINANIETFRSTAYNSRFTYADMEFWIEDEYDLYHYDVVRGEFVAGVNLVEQNGNPEGQTIDEKNEWFKAQRRLRFRNEAPSFWDIQDAIFCFVFLIVIAATDNFAKNSYPYKMKRLANGGLWRWRQDDMDTIADIDNRGSDSKPYYIEFEDADGGSTYFAGSTSVFWNLLYEAFWDDYGTSKGIESFGKDFMLAMATLGGGSNVYESVMNFWKKYFWDNAQNYFPPSAYNVDAAWKYEQAWLANGQAVDALSQSQGNHYLAEKLWFSRRTIYMMSLFKVGPFGSYSDGSLGQIAFRPQSLESITLKPMMWMYPALANGAGSPETTERTQAGASHTFIGPFGTDGQTTFYIQASDFLESLGDWKDLVLAAQYVDVITINAAKLKTFKIGDADGNAVTTNVPLLTFINTKCLESIDARNASALTGALNLEACNRLNSVLVEGTNITQVSLPNGSKIVHLHLSDATNTIRLRNVKYLSDLVMPTDSSVIRTIQIENCGNQNGFDLLRSAYNATDAQLQFIRIILDAVEDISAGDVSMLSSIAANKKKDGTVVNYRGMNTYGDIEGAPVIEGTLHVDPSAGMYLSDLDNLGVVSIEDYGQGLKKAICSAFGPLNIIYNPARLYIPFMDPYVKAVVVNQWGDGVGLLYTDVPSIDSLGTVFRENGDIQTFDELQLFTGLTSIPQNAFYGCVALRNVTLPDTIVDIARYAFDGDISLQSINLPSGLTTLGSNAFRNCASLTSIEIPEGLLTIEDSVFSGCSLLVIDTLHLPELTTLNSGAFKGVKVRHITSLGYITSVGRYTANTGAFEDCVELESVVLPNTVEYLRYWSFKGCSNLRSINLPPSIKAIEERALGGCPVVIDNLYLPALESIDKDAFGGRGTSSVGSVVRISSLGSITTLNSTFSYMPLLVYAKLPGTLTTIGNSAFRGCTALETVDLTGCLGLSTIGDYAFHNCSALEGDEASPYFRALNIPDSITALGQNVFSGCTSLARIRIHALTPPTIQSSTFANNKSIIEVPAESLSAYEQAEHWSAIGHKIVPLNADLYYDISSGGVGMALLAVAAGSEVEVSEMSISDYIVVTAGNELSIFVGSARNYGIIFYDANKEPVSFVSITGSVQTVTVPSGAEYMRTTFHAAEAADHTMYVKDTTTSTYLWPRKATQLGI